MYGAEIARKGNLELIYWAYVESKAAVTADGRMVGLLRGMLINSKT